MKLKDKMEGIGKKIKEKKGNHFSPRKGQ